MKKEMRKNCKNLPNVCCPKCGYNNHKESVLRYGTCKRCNEVLDKKAKFDYEMYCKLHLWRK